MLCLFLVGFRLKLSFSHSAHRLCCLWSSTHSHRTVYWLYYVVYFVIAVVVQHTVHTVGFSIQKELCDVTVRSLYALPFARIIVDVQNSEYIYAIQLDASFSLWLKLVGYTSPCCYFLVASTKKLTNHLYHIHSTVVDKQTESRREKTISMCIVRSSCEGNQNRLLYLYWKGEKGKIINSGQKITKAKPQSYRTKDSFAWNIFERKI